MISVDRYLAVTQALQYTANRTRKRMIGYIAIVWIGALLVSTAPLVVLPLKHVEKTCQVGCSAKAAAFSMCTSGPRSLSKFDVCRTP